MIVVAAAAAAPVDAVEVFVALDPCRVFDTRSADPPSLDNTNFVVNGTPPPPVVAQDVRAVTIAGNPACSVPVGATAVAGNVIVVTPTAAGFLTAFPEDSNFQGASLLNFPVYDPIDNPVDPEFATDNGAVLVLDDDGELGLAWDTTPTSAPGTHTAHIVIDVTGYFVELQTEDGLTLTGDGPVVLGLDPTQLLPESCAAGDVASWDGDSWECADAGGGDVTDVFAGTGLAVQNSAGPQPTLSLDAAFALPTGCQSGEVAAWDGDSWECADQTGGGSGAVVVSHAARHNQLNTSAGAVTFGPAGASNPTDVQTTAPAAQRIEILSPESGCVAQNMRVRQVDPTNADPVSMGVSQQRIFVLMVDGAASGLSCTILTGASTCLSAGTDTIAAGGLRLSIRATNDGTGSFPTADALITWECVVSP